MRAGQDIYSDAHFVSFDGRKAYLIFCSCESFALTFSRLTETAEEVKEAIERKDIRTIVKIISHYEKYFKAKNIDDYIQFISSDERLIEESFIDDFELINVYEEFEEVEEVVY